VIEFADIEHLRKEVQAWGWDGRGYYYSIYIGSTETLGKEMTVAGLEEYAEGRYYPA